MKNIKSVVIVTFTALSLFIMAPAVFAGHSKAQGPGDETGPVLSINDAGLRLSTEQTRTRNQKQDNSCQTPLIDITADSLILARNGGGGHKSGGGMSRSGGHKSGGQRNNDAYRTGSGTNSGGGHGPGDGTGNSGNGPKDGSGHGPGDGTGNGSGHGPGDGTGNGDGPKDGTGNGNKSKTFTNT